MIEKTIQYIAATYKNFSISLISSSFCLGFHLTVVNDSGNLLEKLDSKAIGISI